MKTQKYSVNQHLIETIISWVKSDEIAIPEIQRPFVWNASKVRDLLDSLYQGYPVGYLIAWRNPSVKLKDGTTSEGKKVLIDGQQRVTALTAAILGQYIINSDYKRVKIKIAFNPIEERFEVLNSAIAKDSLWIPDIAPVVSGEIKLMKVIRNYIDANPGIDEDVIEDSISNLTDITKKQIGLIELESDLDIEIVTEVFIRINSKGVVLSQADFAMSKIASNEIFNGPNIRKCIDYFCHLATSPEFYPTIVDVDVDFTKTNYFSKIAWLKTENDDLYDPDYSDLLRVAFTSEFNRGKLSDLVSLLSGRNFETRTYEQEIAKASFEKLDKGILNFINETNFKRFIMIIKSAGFINSSLIRSKSVLNFAYILYLKLRSQDYPQADIESHVRKWVVMSMLTGRYSGSPETRFDYDIRQIASRDFPSYLMDIENAELSDTFWDIRLVQKLNASVSSNPFLHVFWAAQAKSNDKGFLSKDITVNDLLSHRGDIHHIFPKAYLKKKGLKMGQYNQIANYVYMQSEINIKIGQKPPCDYFAELKDQCNGGKALYGAMDSLESLEENLKMNCIPDSIYTMTIDNYDEYLEQRRLMMSKKIKDYYATL